MNTPCPKCGGLKKQASGRCSACATRAVAKYAETHKERASAWKTAYRLRHPDRVKASKDKHRKANKAKELATAAKWRLANKERIRQAIATYRQRFPERVVAWSAKRRCAKRQAVPSWYGELDTFVIQEAASLCRLRAEVTGIEWHVDHIVPLVSSLVCGLHCAANIQVIPASENARKSNLYWPDKPN